MDRLVRVFALNLGMAVTFPLLAQTGLPNFDSTMAERNTRQVAAALPVIVMDKHHGHRPYLSRYRIEIYRNGRGYFYGMRDVRTLGEVSFQLTEQQVVDLLKQFNGLNFWQMDAQLDFSQSPEARLRYEFRARDGGRDKQIFSVGSPQASALHKAIEDVVDSYRWRCPYVNPVIQEDFCRGEVEFLKKDSDLYRPLSDAALRNTK